MTRITLHVGDVRDVMATLKDGSVHGIITSPPFLALRSYLPADHPDKHREIGSEPTPAAFIDTMLGLSAEWRRLLAPWATLCVEIGDTYSGSGNGPDAFKAGREGSHDLWLDESVPKRAGNGWPLPKSLTGIPTLYTWSLAYNRNLLTGTESPAGAWRIRNLLTWTRPNPPVGALGDKCRPATSFVTVACTSARRWFDLDGVRTEATSLDRRQTGYRNHMASGGGSFNDHQGDDVAGLSQPKVIQGGSSNPAGAPPLDWWDETDAPNWQPLHNMATAPYKGAHYATYPLALPSRLLLCTVPQSVCAVCGEPRRRIVGPAEYVPSATYRGGRMVADLERAADGVNQWIGNGTQASVVRNAPTLGWTDCRCPCSVHSIRSCTICHHYRPGVVLDPFSGSGTTAIAAALHGRDAVLIDLDRRNVELVRRRIGENLRIVDEATDGDTITWTVEAPLPMQRHVDPGQTNLFDYEAS